MNQLWGTFANGLFTVVRMPGPKLLRRYDVKLVPDQDFTPAYIPLSRPKGDLQITYAAR